MGDIQLVTDSTCDLSEDLLEAHDIEVIPLFVNFESESYRDGVDIATQEMYQKVDEVGDVPKTSAASPASFEEVFEKHLEKGRKIIYTGIGSGFSATLQNANIAKQKLESDDIYLIDSQNLSSGSGLLLLKAAKYRAEGDDTATIARKMRDLVPRVRTQFVIDTFEYLHKGGRIKAISRFVGTSLRLKPIIKVVDNAMTVGKKGRGNIRQGIKLMLRDVLKDKGNVDEDFFMITHSMAGKQVPYIREEVEKAFDVGNIYETQAGCVISSHCGPGTIGVLYIVKP